MNRRAHLHEAEPGATTQLPMLSSTEVALKRPIRDYDCALVATAPRRREIRVVPHVFAHRAVAGPGQTHRRLTDDWACDCTRPLLPTTVLGLGLGALEEVARVAGQHSADSGWVDDPGEGLHGEVDARAARRGKELSYKNERCAGSRR